MVVMRLIIVSNGLVGQCVTHKQITLYVTRHIVYMRSNAIWFEIHIRTQSMGFKENDYSCWYSFSTHRSKRKKSLMLIFVLYPWDSKRTIVLPDICTLSMGFKEKDYSSWYSYSIREIKGEQSLSLIFVLYPRDSKRKIILPDIRTLSVRLKENNHSSWFIF